jgi:hypothetical protein
MSTLDIAHDSQTKDLDVKYISSILEKAKIKMESIRGDLYAINKENENISAKIDLANAQKADIE